MRFDIEGSLTSYSVADYSRRTPGMARYLLAAKSVALEERHSDEAIGYLVFSASDFDLGIENRNLAFEI